MGCGTKKHYGKGGPGKVFSNKKVGSIFSTLKNRKLKNINQIKETNGMKNLRSRFKNRLNNK